MSKEQDNSIHASIHKNDTTGMVKKIEKAVDNAIMAAIRSDDIGIGWIKKIVKDSKKK